LISASGAVFLVEIPILFQQPGNLTFLFSQRWIARITEFRVASLLCRRAGLGPFKTWHHRHGFAAEAKQDVSGTLVRDVIEYEVGLGWLGAMPDTLFVRRQKESTFAQLLVSLPKLFS
jgi:ligand-binding SRPBCC domain-containing protein